jgi:hypothetical protein
MKAKFGAIVVAGSGKINGFVASRNRAGAYFRTKVTPVNPQTSDQNTVRARLTTNAQAWRGLTNEQRAAWNGAVANFAKTDIFGDLKNPSGFNLYVRLNNNLSAAGQSGISAPPVPAAVSTVLLSSAVYDISDGSFEVTLSGNVPAGTTALIFATPGLSAGVNFVKSEYRLISVQPAATASPIDIIAEYLGKFGAQSAGQKIFVKIVFVNNTTGQTSSPQSLSTIVVA